MVLDDTIPREFSVQMHVVQPVVYWLAPCPNLMPTNSTLLKDHHVFLGVGRRRVGEGDILPQRFAQRVADMTGM